MARSRNQPPDPFALARRQLPVAVAPRRLIVGGSTVRTMRDIGPPLPTQWDRYTGPTLEWADALAMLSLPRWDIFVRGGTQPYDWAVVRGRIAYQVDTKRSRLRASNPRDTDKESRKAIESLSDLANGHRRFILHHYQLADDTHRIELHGGFLEQRSEATLLGTLGRANMEYLSTETGRAEYARELFAIMSHPKTAKKSATIQDRQLKAMMKTAGLLEQLHEKASEVWGYPVGIVKLRHDVQEMRTRANEEAARAKEQKTRAEQEAARAEQEAARAEEQKTRAEQEAVRAEQEAARAEEQKTRAEQEAVRAEQEAARAEEQKTRAEQEAARAAQLEMQMARLLSATTPEEIRAIQAEIAVAKRGA